MWITHWGCWALYFALEKRKERLDQLLLLFIISPLNWTCNDLSSRSWLVSCSKCSFCLAFDSFPISLLFLLQKHDVTLEIMKISYLVLLFMMFDDSLSMCLLCAPGSILIFAVLVIGTFGDAYSHIIVLLNSLSYLLESETLLTDELMLCFIAIVLLIF